MDAKFFRRRLRWLWKQNGLKFTGQRPGFEIAQIVKISRKRSANRKLEHFDLWNAIYDEYCSWFMSLVGVLNGALNKDEIAADEARKFYASVCVVTFRVVADLLAIRALCNMGFDTSAQPLARVVIEHIDLIYLINKKPELSKDFATADWNEDANKFRHEHLSKGKVRKFMVSDWEKMIFKSSLEAVGFDQWLYGRHDVLSLSTHPSFVGSWFATHVPGAEEQEPWFGFLGEKSDISANTFAMVCTHIWKLVFLLSKFPFEIEGHPSLSIPYRDDNELHSHVREGGAR